MKELSSFNIDPVLVNWIKAFLTDRRQAVRIGNFLSDLKFLKGGIPQGTKLGAILFKVMTNKLLKYWKLRIKFVDDTTALEDLEVLLGTCYSLLNLVANDIYNFFSDHNMSLNPKNLKEMLVNLIPIILDNNVVDRVPIYKLLGVYIQ